MVQVSAVDAQKFGQVWTHNGVAIVMTPIHYQFAADFANIAVRSFIENAQRQALAAKKAAEDAAKPKVLITEG